MSKKKNTLKDLDEFLKQQAASLVSPEPVTVSPLENSINQEAAPEISPAQITYAGLLADLQVLANQEPATFRKEFYDMIVKTLESFPSTLAEDKMLINTALYLKSGERWKEAIREYWKKHS
jgi:hypothetical protein